MSLQFELDELERVAHLYIERAKNLSAVPNGASKVDAVINALLSIDLRLQQIILSAKIEAQELRYKKEAQSIP